MNKVLILGAMLALVAAPAPAFADAKDDYMAACMKASGDNTELCTCKTTEMMKVADEEMLPFLILNLSDPQKFNEKVNKGEVPKTVIDKWPFYVRDTNKVCLPPSN
ncbi:MAG TPA: hypothetical protein PK286_14525 [Devosia sp.]|nr:hypothetical protein [Devosia sp.]